MSDYLLLKAINDFLMALHAYEIDHRQVLMLKKNGLPSNNF